MGVADYAGTYYVKQASSCDDRIQLDDQIDIDTDGNVTITQGTSTVLQELFSLDEEFGCLRCDRSEDGRDFSILISRYEQTAPDIPYKALYGAVIKRNPDSVGAWGADDDPGTGGQPPV